MSPAFNSLIGAVDRPRDAIGESSIEECDMPHIVEQFMPASRSWGCEQP